jgi:hypothetical protein
MPHPSLDHVVEERQIYEMVCRLPKLAYQIAHKNQRNTDSDLWSCACGMRCLSERRAVDCSQKYQAFNINSNFNFSPQMIFFGSLADDMILDYHYRSPYVVTVRLCSMYPNRPVLQITGKPLALWSAHLGPEFLDAIVFEDLNVLGRLGLYSI